jgi:uncharacterized protein YhbP (UPF0306 family)
MRSLLDTLEETALCSLATVGRTGRAHVNTAYFEYSDDLAVYFLSHPRARHCENLERNRSGALSIFRSDQTWGGQDRGVQLFGEARRVVGRARVVAESVYSARFPLYRRWLDATTSEGRQIGLQLRTYSFYRFRSRKVKVFDEETFGDASFVSASVKAKSWAAGPRSWRGG